MESEEKKSGLEGQIRGFPYVVDISDRAESRVLIADKLLGNDYVTEQDIVCF